QKPVPNNKNKKKQNKSSKNFKAIGIILAFVIVFLAGFGFAKNYFSEDDDGQVLNTDYSSQQNDEHYNSSEDQENEYYEEELVQEDLDQTENTYTDDDAISQSQITELIDNLEYNYDEAINTGNVDLVYPYITETGNLRKNYDKYIPEWHEEGLRTYIKDADYGQFEYEDGEYRISRVSINKVVQNNKIHYEKEYIEFILVENDNLELLVDRCENYSMLDSDYNY
ncbi:TcaA NTF2-like domain-containing protein, partial [Intestinibacter sp.]|uniref:TcaA NTF2-like domain-containing protein n=1 Tax=Intestinibacter sp. TaxID=1965304 RepID=UPI003F13F424